MIFGWPELVALLTSIGFGVVSALLPLINAEAYIGASQVSAAAGPVLVAAGVAVGQTIGKVAMFFAVRQGRQLPAIRKKRSESRTKPVGPKMQEWRAFVARLLELVGDPKWGLPITFAAASVGLPPLYAVALLAGATKMRALWFALVVFAGRLLRFVLVALGIGWAVHLWT